MKRILFLLLLFSSTCSLAQTKNLADIKAPADLDNISNTPLTDDSLSSGFIIFVKVRVKLHKHAHHTEQVYILEGTGEMTLGDKVFTVKAGDFFIIPKNTPHALKVTSATPVKLISIQSPHFDGTDRIFLE